MLRSSFAQIPGIGAATEQRLWQEGYDSWDTLLAGLGAASLGTADREIVRIHLEESLRALEGGDAAFFQKALGQREAWRAWEAFRDRCVYLDIETDGGQLGSSVTIVGLYDGAEFKALVKERDLDDLLDLLEPSRMLVTFFGSGFDLPMLEKRFRGHAFTQIHLDLCPTLRRLGLRGGLKSIERQLGIARGEDTDGLSGWDAVKLWNRYYHLGDDMALERLIAYNREDVVNLETLAGYAFERLKVQTMLGNLVNEAPDRKSPRNWPPPSRRSRPASPSS
ncbi:MAG: ribonuclease H-like domain-containing protein [Fimbriimonadaceae bacterium]